MRVSARILRAEHNRVVAVEQRTDNGRAKGVHVHTARVLTSCHLRRLEEGRTYDRVARLLIFQLRHLWTALWPDRSEINQDTLSSCVYENVLWFHVSMHQITEFCAVRTLTRPLAAVCHWVVPNPVIEGMQVFDSLQSSR